MIKQLFCSYKVIQSQLSKVFNVRSSLALKMNALMFCFWPYFRQHILWESQTGSGTAQHSVMVRESLVCICCCTMVRLSRQAGWVVRKEAAEPVWPFPASPRQRQPPGLLFEKLYTSGRPSDKWSGKRSCDKGPCWKRTSAPMFDCVKTNMRKGKWNSIKCSDCLSISDHLKIMEKRNADIEESGKDSKSMGKSQNLRMQWHVLSCIMHLPPHYWHMPFTCILCE